MSQRKHKTLRCIKMALCASPLQAVLAARNGGQRWRLIMQHVFAWSLCTVKVSHVFGSPLVLSTAVSLALLHPTANASAQVRRAQVHWRQTALRLRGGGGRPRRSRARSRACSRCRSQHRSAAAAVPCRARPGSGRGERRQQMARQTMRMTTSKTVRTAALIRGTRAWFSRISHAVATSDWRQRCSRDSPW